MRENEGSKGMENYNDHFQEATQVFLFVEKFL